MPKLKSCPFCGADSYSLRVEKFGINIHLHRAGCGVCLAEGPLSRSEEEAFAVWNTRADEVRVRRETIEECALVLTEKSYAFCGINASVAGALHTAARELLDMIEVDHAGTELPTMEG